MHFFLKLFLSRLFPLLLTFVISLNSTLPALAGGAEDVRVSSERSDASQCAHCRGPFERSMSDAPEERDSCGTCGAQVHKEECSAALEGKCTTVGCPDGIGSKVETNVFPGKVSEVLDQDYKARLEKIKEIENSIARDISDEEIERRINILGMRFLQLLLKAAPNKKNQDQIQVESFNRELQEIILTFEVLLDRMNLLKDKAVQSVVSEVDKKYYWNSVRATSFSGIFFGSMTLSLVLYAIFSEYAHTHDVKNSITAVAAFCALAGMSSTLFALVIAESPEFKNKPDLLPLSYPFSVLQETAQLVVFPISKINNLIKKNRKIKKAVDAFTQPLRSSCQQLEIAGYQYPHLDGLDLAKSYMLQAYCKNIP